MRRNEIPLAVDMPLLTAIILLCATSAVVMYSAGGEDLDSLARQGTRIALAFPLMLLCARIPPASLMRWSPVLYGIGLALLILVLAAGFIGKGAQRWLGLGLFRFQPAEIMKLAVPMMVAWILTRSPLPPRPFALMISVIVVLAPVALVVAQPDLGTAILIGIAGLLVIFLAGISWKLVVAVLLALGAVAPALWTMMLHDYQRRRILTLFDPWADPSARGTIASSPSSPWVRAACSAKAGLPAPSRGSISSRKGAPISSFSVRGGIRPFSVYLCC